MYARESSGNPNPNALEPDHPAAMLPPRSIPSSSFSLGLAFPQEKYGIRFRSVNISNFCSVSKFTCLILRNLNMRLYRPVILFILVTRVGVYNLYNVRIL